MDSQDKKNKPKENSSENKQTVSEEKGSKVKLTYAEKKEWDTIEQDLFALESDIETTKNEMLENSSDFTRLQELQETLTRRENQLEQKMARWEYLSQFENE